MNCLICCETGRTRGFLCACKNEICIFCEARLTSCPYCRLPYPPVVVRIIHHGVTNDTLFPYLAPIHNEISESQAKFEWARQLYQGQPFYLMLVLKETNDLQLYALIMDRVVQELYQATATAPRTEWKYLFHFVRNFLDYYYINRAEYERVIQDIKAYRRELAPRAPPTLLPRPCPVKKARLQRPKTRARYALKGR